MIIDVHNHLGEDIDGTVQTPQMLLARMEAAGVDIAVVFPFNDVDPGVCFSKANERIAEACEEHEEFVGFCRVDPNCEERAVEEVERCVEELELKGVKLHPRSQSFYPDDPEAVKVVEKAADLGVPVILHTARGEPFSDPVRVGKLAEEVPDVQLIMAHMGKELGYDAAIEVAENHENVYLEISLVKDPKVIEKAAERVGDDRIVFGSDSPYGSPSVQLEILKEADVNHDKILGENAADILGLW
ncbi:amidohydrolase family protein [Methanopyrus sp.]